MNAALSRVEPTAPGSEDRYLSHGAMCIKDD